MRGLGGCQRGNPEKQLMIDSLTEDVQRALSRLTVREADLIGLYFGLNKKSPDIRRDREQVQSYTRTR